LVSPYRWRRRIIAPAVGRAQAVFSAMKAQSWIVEEAPFVAESPLRPSKPYTLASLSRRLNDLSTGDEGAVAK
jgi:hypothetical protein